MGAGGYRGDHPDLLADRKPINLLNNLIPPELSGNAKPRSGLQMCGAGSDLTKQSFVPFPLARILHARHNKSTPCTAIETDIIPLTTQMGFLL